MDRKVVWSPSARADLKDIVSYIADDNPRVAERFGYALIEASKALARFERKGRKVPEFDIEDVRELIVSPYRLIYRIKERENVLEVVRLWHGARGSPEL